MSAGASTIVITLSSALAANEAFKAWIQCKVHNAAETAVNPYYCASTVLSYGLAWGISLATLGAINGWWKREDVDG